MIVGHLPQRFVLESKMPSTPVLLVGPRSVGKATLAEHLAQCWKVNPDDVVWVSHLSMDDARRVASLSHYESRTGTRLFVITATNAGPEALNVLLKTIEEGYRVNRFLLLSEHDLPETLQSRCWTMRLGYLTEEEVAKVLEGRNFHPKRAAELAALAGGQVDVALGVANNGTIRATVLAAVRALQSRDTTTLDDFADRWTDDHTAELVNLCAEGISGRWHHFSPADLEAVTKPLFLRILRALSQDVRPRLVVRSSLMSILRSTS